MSSQKLQGSNACILNSNKNGVCISWEKQGMAAVVELQMT